MSLRNIIKNVLGKSGILNIVGMSVALASMYILLVQVGYDTGYNRKVKDSDRIYALSMPSWYDDTKYSMWLNRPIPEMLISGISCVEAGGMCNNYGQCVYYVQRGEEWHELSMHHFSSSQGIIGTLGIELLEGSFDDITANHDLFISESASERYSLHTGDVLSLDEGHNYLCKVKGVFRDFPDASDFSGIDVLYDFGDGYIDDTSEWSWNYYVKLKSAGDRDDFEAQAETMLQKFYADQYADELSGASDEEMQELENEFSDIPKVHLVGLRDTYFDKTFDGAGRQGSKTATYTLLLIAILIIVIAFINYVNFFIAKIPMRIRGINTRKILGSSRASLVAGLVAESIASILVSLLIAAILVKLFGMTSFARLISCGLGFGQNAGVVAIAIAAPVLLAAFSGFFLARYATSFNPAFVIKGSFGSTSKGKRLRYALIGFQFVISIALIICAGFIKLNHDYMLHKDIGVDREYLLGASVNSDIYNSKDAVRSKLLANPQIAGITWANGKLVAEGRMGWGRGFKEENIHFQCYPVYWNYLRFMGIEIVEGRDFNESDELSEDGVFIFNEAARDQFGLTLEDKIEGHEGPTEIAGFCKNFNFKPVQYGIEPFCFYVFGKNSWKPLSRLYVRTTPDADIRDVLQYIKTSLAELSPWYVTHQADIVTFDEEVGPNYSREEDLASLIGIFTVISIIISLMGLFGLVLFETQYRRKEIGLRRVQGAQISDILVMFNRKFIYIVLVCFVIAAPVCYIIVSRYFSGFAQHCPVYWWVFALALLVVLVLTVIVVTLRSLSAACANPVESLRTE